MKLIRIITVLLLFFYINLNADLINDGDKEYNNGNENKALELWSQACDGGNMEGCYKMGKLYFNRAGAKQDKRQAKVLFKKACDGGHSLGCTFYGVLDKAGVK